jgi:2-dehydropantoate 2-reductase
MAASVLRLGLDARIVIAGAGSIGCFAGGLLMRGGRNVSFLGRPRALEELRTSGLHLTDLGGLDERFPAWRLTLSAIPSELRSADLVLVTVKSGATDSIASDIAAHCRPGAVILTLQNGVSNKAVLSAALPHMTVLGGIVAYNVVHQGAGHFHRGTSGGVTIEAGRDDVAALLSVPGFGL